MPTVRRRSARWAYESAITDFSDASEVLYVRATSGTLRTDSLVGLHFWCARDWVTAETDAYENGTLMLELRVVSRVKVED